MGQQQDLVWPTTTNGTIERKEVSVELSNRQQGVARNALSLTKATSAPGELEARFRFQRGLVNTCYEDESMDLGA
jgi:hypothetical protein